MGHEFGKLLFVASFIAHEHCWKVVGDEPALSQTRAFLMVLVFSSHTKAGATIWLELRRLSLAKRITLQVPHFLSESRTESLHLLPRSLARPNTTLNLTNQQCHQSLTAVPCSTVSSTHGFEQLPW